MKTVVIGYGSIGSRHARILRELGCYVAIVTQQSLESYPHYPSLEEAVSSEKPEYVVVANRTSAHHHSLWELSRLGFQGITLVEKPLFHEIFPYPGGKQKIFVGYNLRFHPVVQRLYSLLQSAQILTMQVYVGQYLPTWRPQQDYRASYSAHREEGGGVLLDLSHELDYLRWMLGEWTSLTALGGHVSTLEITSDDIFLLLLSMERCPALTLQMNYLDRVTHREILINTNEHTIKADLVHSTLSLDGISQSFEINRDDTYRKQHASILQHDFQYLCSLEEGMKVLQMIKAAEQAAQEQTWITYPKNDSVPFAPEADPKESKIRISENF